MRSIIISVIKFLFINIALFLLFSSSLCAQKLDSKTLLTIGNQPVSTEEFERIYLKNRGLGVIENGPISVDEYLELFINFKLKVIEASELGYDTVPGFIVEFEGYEDQLAMPYLTDQATIDKLSKEAYERMQYDVNASHILIKTNPDASPEDTLAAYEKVMKISDRFITGESFEIIARGTSDDPSVKSNGGNLGYFTVFQMVYPFETAAYNSRIGEMSFPVRTRFGYHIIIVHDKRKAIGSIKVAHIMVAVPRGSSQEKKEAAKKKIHMVYTKINNGEDFRFLAKEYSDDYNSAQNGGELPWFGTGRMVEEFESAAFKLKKNGDISEPVRTGFGWHIIKRIDKKEIGTYEEMRREIEKKIYSGSRADIAINVFIKNLKKKYNFKNDSSKIWPLYSSLTVNSSKNGGWLKGLSRYSGNTLFSFAGKKFTVADFSRYLNNQPGLIENETSKSYVNKMLSSYENNELISYEKSKLENNYPDFKYLLKEYHDGMLLFEISDKKVWSKAVEDTTGLKEYYENHKNEYLGDEQFEIIQFTFNDRSLIKEINKVIRKCRRYSNIDCYSGYFPPDSVSAPVTVSIQKYDKENSNQIDAAYWKKGFKKTFTEGNKTKLILVNDIIEAQPKKLEEVMGLITSDYQNYLESQWYIQLKEKYPVKINTRALNELKQKLD